MKDFALFVKMLVDEEYPDVEVVRLVMDNLSTHKEKAFYETFTKDEAERILMRHRLSVLKREYFTTTGVLSGYRGI